MQTDNPKLNHLQDQTSPYLQQHKANPVDWYPWGQEALNKARNEDKPIFLSIGYATCYWCHVMAEESFEDEAVAEILNSHFVAIKVDREERPDLDHLYMGVVNMITGSGGWPLNVWLTPSLKPIYGGTYFPKDNRLGHAGFITVLTSILNLWRQKRQTIEEKGTEMIAFLKKHTITSPLPLEDTACENGINALKKRYDKQWGGFGGAPKFPAPHQLLFLLSYGETHRDGQAIEMVNHTLKLMGAGGIQDHVGGGFSRYSVDPRWEIPHFEKMLYDNLLLLRAYNEGYLMTKEPLFRVIAYRIIQYLKREMLSLKGGFYTALSADVDHVEGKYYVFDQEELVNLLGQEAGDFMADFNVTDYGNFEGKNHLFVDPKKYHEDLYTKHKASLNKLLTYRETRKKPDLDYKMMTWLNGLSVSQIAFMARLYKDPDLVVLAKEARDYIRWDLIVEGHLISHRTKMIPSGQVFLDDYAYYIEGLLEIYMTTYEEKDLEEARRQMDKAIDLFWDETHGGFYMSLTSEDPMVIRQKVFIDGAIPSGNSVMAHNLYRLHLLTEAPTYEDRYDALIQAFGKHLKDSPDLCAYGLMPILKEQRGAKILKVVLPTGIERSDLYQYLPPTSLSYDVIMVVNESLYPLKNNQITYYPCEGFVCNEPVNEL